MEPGDAGSVGGGRLWRAGRGGGGVLSDALGVAATCSGCTRKLGAPEAGAERGYPHRRRSLWR